MQHHWTSSCKTWFNLDIRGNTRVYMHDCHHVHLSSGPATRSFPVALPHYSKNNIKTDISRKHFPLSSQCRGRRLAHSAAFRLHVNEPKDNVFHKEKRSAKMNFRRASPLRKYTLRNKQRELGRAKFKTFLAWFGLLQSSYLPLSHIIKHRSETGSGIMEQTELRTSEDTCPINRNHLPIQSNTHMFWQPLSQ